MAIESDSSSVDNLASLHDVSRDVQNQTVHGVADIIAQGQGGMDIAESAEHEHLARIRRLGYLISDLSYHDYLVVEDFASRIRSGGVPNNLAVERGVFHAADVQHALVGIDAAQVSPEVHEIISLLLDLQGTEEFQTDAVLFIRAAYPFGKNILNREFKGNQPSAVKVKEGIKAEFTMNKTTVTVEVHAGDLCTVNCEGSTKPLPEGAALVVGRDFRKGKFFDQSVSDISGGESSRIKIKPELPVNKDEHVSRAGLMLVRQGGLIYAFDRGSRNTFSFNVSMNREETMSGTYNPGIEGDDGMLGQSMVNFTMPPDELRRLGLGDSSDSVDSI